MTPDPLRIGLDPTVKPWATEAKYVLGELARIAGYPVAFAWAEPGAAGAIDVYYGPRAARVRARVRIPADPDRGLGPSDVEPRAVFDFAGLRLLDFEGDRTAGSAEGEVLFPTDIVRGAFWLLTGAREPAYGRDRWDNLQLDGSVMRTAELYLRPIVSEYGEFLRNHLASPERRPLARPWCDGQEAAFVLTHDVDYPEIIRWIEVLRAFGAGGRAGRRRAAAALRDPDAFWQFDAWTEFARGLGTRPSFYFMAARGSLPRYLLGTPDAFYDIRSPRFRNLFARMKEEGVDVGLHASYRAYENGAHIASEKELLESTIGRKVYGGRHHYWHLDPSAPNDTLLAHERAGLQYDSSLAFEGYPGFRRGVCHPFMPFHPVERREIDVVQLPPTWMDDHFHRRRASNRIGDPAAVARALLRTVRRTNGVAVVDYHVRGMNGDFFPEYGPWLRDFLADEASGLRFTTAVDVNREYRAYVASVDEVSRDETGLPSISIRGATPTIEFGPMQADETDAVASLHYEFFGAGDVHGWSLAKLGPSALAGLFYAPGLDNPELVVDLARHNGRPVAFSVYSAGKGSVLGHALRTHLWSMCKTGLAAAGRKPSAVMSLLANLRYLVGEELPDEVAQYEPRGWWIVAGVLPRYRTKEFVAQTGLRIADVLVERMERAMTERTCRVWYGVVRGDNIPMTRFMQRWGGKVVARKRSQGQEMEYYLRCLEAPAEVPLPASGTTS